MLKNIDAALLRIQARIFPGCRVLLKALMWLLTSYVVEQPVVPSLWSDLSFPSNRYVPSTRISLYLLKCSSIEDHNRVAKPDCYLLVYSNSHKGDEFWSFGEWKAIQNLSMPALLCRRFLLEGQTPTSLP